MTVPQALAVAALYAACKACEVSGSGCEGVSSSAGEPFPARDRGSLNVLVRHAFLWLQETSGKEAGVRCPCSIVPLRTGTPLLTSSLRSEPAQLQADQHVGLIASFACSPGCNGTGNTAHGTCASTAPPWPHSPSQRLHLAT